MRTVIGWLLLLMLLGTSAGSAEASTPQTGTVQPIHPQSIVSQTQKETWLLDAIVKGDRLLAWQIASTHLTVDYQGQILVVRGLNVDLGYRGQQGTPLYQVLKKRSSFYRSRPAELHRDLTNPDRVVHLSRPVDARNILIPGSVMSERSYEIHGQSYTQVGQKLYRDEYRTLQGIPQLVLRYDPQATETYATHLATARPTSQLVVTSREMTDEEVDYWYGTDAIATEPVWID